MQGHAARADPDGYASRLEALANPKLLERLEWLRSQYKPDAFDIDAVYPFGLRRS